MWLVKRYESNLAVSDERNRTLVRNGGAIVVIDDDGMTLHTNPSAESLFGIPGERVRMRSGSDFWQPDALSALPRTDTPAERESEIRTGAGRTITAFVRTCRFDFLGSDSTYLLFRDTTEEQEGRVGNHRGQPETQRVGQAEILFSEHGFARVENPSDIDKVVDRISFHPQQKLG